jgi:hypothetical protein
MCVRICGILFSVFDLFCVLRYKLQNGKFVIPSLLEAAICRSIFIDQACVHGENLPHNIAIVVPNWANVTNPIKSHLFSHLSLRVFKSDLLYISSSLNLICFSLHLFMFKSRLAFFVLFFKSLLWELLCFFFFKPGH